MTARMTTSAWLRYAILRRLLPADVESLVEIGAGKGALGSLLADRLDYTGLEPDAESFAAAERLLDGKVQCVREEDFDPGRTFDALLAFEVLEHIEDDVAVLERWRRRLRPEGWIFLSVPSGRSRFGPLDVKAGHFRRYDRADLARALGEAGYEDPVICSYGFPVGYVLLAGMNLLARRAPVRTESMEIRTAASGRWFQPTRGTAVLTRALAAPFAIVQRPFEQTSLGIGFVARARAA